MGDGFMRGFIGDVLWEMVYGRWFMREDFMGELCGGEEKGWGGGGGGGGLKKKGGGGGGGRGWYKKRK